MSTLVNWNGQQYLVPAYNDTGYAQGNGNLSQYLVAISTGSLQQVGGLFQLTADADFGPNFGLVSSYFKSRSANIASAGVLRLANTDAIKWRNSDNSADVTLAMNATGTAARTYTIPDLATSSFVMTEGAQTINGVKTFGSAIVGSASLNLLLTGGTLTGALLAAAGSVGAPGISFTGDSNTGFYFISADDIGIATGGVAQFHFAGNIFAVVGTNTAGQILSSAGSATAPSFGFNVIGSNQTGLYLISTDLIGITVGGVSKYQFNGSNFGVVGTNTTGQFLGSAGTVYLPSFAFNVTGSGDTGLYLIGTDNIGVSCGGVQQISIDTANFTIAGRLQLQNGTVASPSLQFTGDPNTGLYSIGADSFGFSTNGILRLSIDTAAITSALPLAMGTNKITGLTAGTAAGDAVNVGQLLYRQAPIQGTKTTSFSTTSTSYVATGLTATITPTSSASRIKVTVSVPGFDSSNSTLGFAYMTVARNTTDLSNGSGFAISASGSTLQFISNVGFCYIDSPASTSATVYEVYIKIDNALVTARLNGLTGTCTIILEEIA